MVTQMLRHGNTSIYPTSQEAIDSIAANMAQNGFDPDFPILTMEVDGEREIIDGWHRYQAALQAGVEPQFRPFDGDANDALRFIQRAQRRPAPPE